MTQTPGGRHRHGPSPKRVHPGVLRSDHAILYHICPYIHREGKEDFCPGKGYPHPRRRHEAPRRQAADGSRKEFVWRSKTASRLQARRLPHRDRCIQQLVAKRQTTTTKKSAKNTPGESTTCSDGRRRRRYP